MNVLLLTDFSENSKNAILYGLSLFKDVSCNFYVLNVQKARSFTTDDFMTAPPGASVYESLMRDNAQALDEFMEPIIADNNKDHHSFKCLVDFDIFSDAVTQVVSLYDIDYICMGTNGVTGAKEVLFGSNTMNVIRHIKAPVIIIPQDYNYEPVEKVLFSVTKNYQANEDHLMPLKRICGMTNCSIDFVAMNAGKANSNIRDTMNHMAQTFFSDISYNTHEMEHLKPADAILAYEQLNKVQFHALFYHRESFIERWFDSSQTSKISHSSLVPLLILPI